MIIDIKGYLIVLFELKDVLGNHIYKFKNKKYKGVDRRPGYHFANHYPHPYYYEAEIEALDKYIFGDYVDKELDVILSLERAVELLNMLKRSPRKFEIIYVESIREEGGNILPVERKNEVFLGYDVAQNGAPFMSYLLDGVENEEMAEYFDKLNKYRLFDNYEIAKNYWSRFQELKWDGWDDLVTVFKVYRVILEGDSHEG